MERIAYIVAWCLCAGWAFAQQTYPTKSIRLIVPYPPGGGADAMGRVLAEALSARFAQQVVVDNRGGASTTIGADLVAKSPADGYTLFLATVTTLAVVPNVRSKLPYDFERDFSPVSTLARQPYVLAAHPSVPATNVKQLVAYLNANRGKVNYGSPGVASGGHIAGEMFKQMAGVDMTHITYKGSGPAAADLLGGHIALMFTTIPAVYGGIKDGKLRAIAVTTAKRTPALPDTPTMAESGISGYETNSWSTMLVPKGTPAPIIARLNSEIAIVLRSSEALARLTPQGFDPEPSTPRYVTQYVKAEVVRYGKLLKAMGVTNL
ncbi:MAG: Bug family tripartite tricarboxylate transporter substrate binding protein [Vulcanimicrobiaceae bacterium]